MFKNILVGNHSYAVEYPNECPICHHHSEIECLKTTEEPDNTGVQTVFQCAYSGCRSYFVGYYGPRGSKELYGLKPQQPTTSTIPDSIKEISPNFVSIYKEAEEAQQLGLSQIAGPGYRKAFEFLIKDYAISIKPENQVDIESMFSGNVVKEFITDPRIQAVAKRALWLGNDETHYLKKWVAHDIDDLTGCRTPCRWSPQQPRP